MMVAISICRYNAAHNMSDIGDDDDDGDGGDGDDVSV